ncbi:class A sortase [Neobacillus sp.]|uniref:class A sortase n=1 Tax=Neobacillus sp. TaxID=2675273 RepID=UPI0028979298|nr:class A sortase [Neobacillus sp.]
MMKKKILPICLMVIGFIILMTPIIKNYMVTSLSKKSYENLTIQTEKDSIVNQSKSMADIDFVTEEDIIKAMLSGSDSNGIGLLAIPSVNLKLPIFRETTKTNLLKGAGMLNETFHGFNTGNVILVGHHMKKEGLLFQPLTKLKAGGNVYIMDHEKVYQYQMGEPFIVNEEDISVLIEPFEGITLITCDAPTPTKKRLIYQGKLVNEVKKQEMEKIFH